jgi:hypothetical protein
MPVQLKQATDKIHGGQIDKKMIIEMVDYYRIYRRKDGSSLKFAHFTVTEILELLVDNNIIDPLTQQQQSKALTYGVKVYVANHANDPSTCPTGRTTTYQDKDTVIICNTQLTPLGGQNTWVDMLDDTQWVSIPGAGGGLDKSTICPPDCPGYKDPENNYNMDVSSNG